MKQVLINISFGVLLLTTNQNASAAAAPDTLTEAKGSQSIKAPLSALKSKEPNVVIAGAPSLQGSNKSLSNLAAGSELLAKAEGSQVGPAPKPKELDATVASDATKLVPNAALSNPALGPKMLAKAEPQPDLPSAPTSKEPSTAAVVAPAASEAAKSSSQAPNGPSPKAVATPDALEKMAGSQPGLSPAPQFKEPEVATAAPAASDATKLVPNAPLANLAAGPEVAAKVEGSQSDVDASKLGALAVTESTIAARLEQLIARRKEAGTVAKAATKAAATAATALAEAIKTETELKTTLDRAKEELATATKKLDAAIDKAAAVSLSSASLSSTTAAEANQKEHTPDTPGASVSGVHEMTAATRVEEAIAKYNQAVTIAATAVIADTEAAKAVAEAVAKKKEIQRELDSLMKVATAEKERLKAVLERAAKATEEDVVFSAPSSAAASPASEVDQKNGGILSVEEPGTASATSAAGGASGPGPDGSRSNTAAGTTITATSASAVSSSAAAPTAKSTGMFGWLTAWRS